MPRACPHPLPRRPALLGWTGLILTLAACQEPPTAPAAHRAVRTVTLERRPLGATTRYSGSLEPRERVDLGFKLGGKVRTVAEVGEGDARRPIQEGDPVQRGQVLAELDDADFRAQARAAAAGVATADAQVHGGEQAVAHAATQWERAKALQAGGAMAQADLERAEAAWRAARANLDAARGQRQGRTEQQALAKSAVGDAVLTSPLDGVVARRMVEVGSSVGPGTVAFTLIDTSTMRAVFGVPDLRIQALHLGDRVPVQVEALSGRILAGTISKIHPVADPVLRSFAVEVTIANSDGDLRSGLVASAAFDAGARTDAMLAPLAAIVRPPGGAGFAVWVLDSRTRRVALRPVELGDLSGNDVLIEAGLQPGEQVVTEGAPFLHEGQTVEVTP
jgi:RND family efflux transporter MFP subunit